MSELADLQAKALKIKERYKILNKSSNYDEWGAKEYAMGLVGDTGDLLKLVMAKDNLRKIENADEKLKHELADCLWSLLVLADLYKIDLDKAFTDTMQELDKRLAGESK